MSAVIDKPAVEEKAKRYHYEPGAVRWLLVRQDINPLTHPAYRVMKGWKLEVLDIEYHPITFDRLQSPQTWVRETYIGDRA